MQGHWDKGMWGQGHGGGDTGVWGHGDEDGDIET